MNPKHREFFSKLDKLFNEYGVTYFGSCGCCDGTSIRFSNDDKDCYQYLDLITVSRFANDYVISDSNPGNWEGKGIDSTLNDSDCLTVNFSRRAYLRYREITKTT